MAAKQADLESKGLGNIKKFDAEKFQMVLHGSLALLLEVGLVIIKLLTVGCSAIWNLGALRAGSALLCPPKPVFKLKE